MIIQGSNNPIVIQFDKNIDTLPTLVVTLWSDRAGYPTKLLKRWNNGDMEISGDTVVCHVTEGETKMFPNGDLVFEAKGLDEYGNTVFWDQYKTDVKTRRDKIIMIAQPE